MIKIETEIEDGRCTISISGHANYAEYGKDIVCASVSILFQAFVNEIIRNDTDADVIIESLFTSEDYAEVSYYDVEGEYAKCYEMLINALIDIADNYPENVKITNKK